MGIFRIVAALFRSIVVDRAELAAENLALRQQLAVLQQKLKRPRLRSRDRIFWALLSRIWANWRSALLIVQPDTVVGWHRQSFKLFWRWKSQRRRGRPRIEAEIRKLIRRMSRESPLWGTPRIQSELALLGRIVAESTVDQYRIIPRKPPPLPGVPSSTTMSVTSPPSTSLPSPPRHFAYFSPSSFFVTIGAMLFTSTSPLIRRRNGQRSRSWRLFHSTKRRAS